MTQNGLIHWIIKALNIDRLHGAHGKDEGGEEAHVEYNDPSVTGTIW
jgi:hypothetical protein